MTSQALCEQYGIDFPLFAFSHCRDVVAAVTNAGGFGVLGATAYTPEQLDRELTWIDEAVGGKPYGVDLIVPAKFEGKGEKLSGADLARRIPQTYRDLVDDLLRNHDIEPEPERRLGGASSLLRRRASRCFSARNTWRSLSTSANASTTPCSTRTNL